MSFYPRSLRNFIPSPNLGTRQSICILTFQGSENFTPGIFTAQEISHIKHVFFSSNSCTVVISWDINCFLYQIRTQNYCHFQYSKNITLYLKRKHLIAYEYLYSASNGIRSPCVIITFSNRNHSWVSFEGFAAAFSELCETGTFYVWLFNRSVHGCLMLESLRSRCEQSMVGRYVHFTDTIFVSKFIDSSHHSSPAQPIFMDKA